MTAQRTSATRIPVTSLLTNPNYTAANTHLVDMSAADTTGASITVDGTAFDIAAALQTNWSGKTLTDVVNGLKVVTSGATKLSDLVDITTNGTDISFKTKSAGPSSAIVISAGTGVEKDMVANLFSVDTAANADIDLGVGKIVGTGSADLTNPNVAQDAKLKFNGTDVTSASNAVKLLGVTYTLKNMTAAANTVTITKDIDAEVKNITDFVSKYNICWIKSILRLTRLFTKIISR